VERELLMAGIGGQGVQLAAQLLAKAATGSGRHAQLFGSYGGMMRGGNTDATVISITRSGIPCSVISCPTRYIHSPVEVLSLRDLDNGAALIAAAIERAHVYF